MNKKKKATLNGGSALPRISFLEKTLQVKLNYHNQPLFSIYQRGLKYD